MAFSFFHSSHGNQIGPATTHVSEIYDAVTKRKNGSWFVAGAVPKSWVSGENQMLEMW